MRYRLPLLAAVIGIVTACSSATAPCAQIVRPVLLGRLLHLNSTGTCILSADSLYSRIEVLADTFRVCGSDTVRLSGVERRFTDTRPICQ